MTTTDDAPTTGAEDVRWNLDDLYTGPDDPAFGADLRDAVTAAEAFAGRYRGTVADLDAAGLATALAELEAVAVRLGRAGAYAQLRFATDTDDEARGALVARVMQEATAAQTALLFFELEWAAADDATAERLLAEPEVATYRHHLTQVRALRPHQLAEGEERVAAELGQTGAAAWNRLFTQETSRIRVHVDGHDEPKTLDDALGGLHDADRDRRQATADAVTDALDSDLATRTYIFNTVLQEKAVTDRLRSHPHWLHSRNLSNEASDGQVDALVDAVTGRYDLVARWYRVKARLLGLDTLTDVDRYAPIDAAGGQTIRWDDARGLVLDAYGDFAPQMADLARGFFDDGWIDAAPRPGKQGGAFAHPVTPDVHPYVLVNYGGRSNDVLTLAHELGHGVHMRLSQGQTPLNAGTPLTTAETASILGETITFARLRSLEADPAARLALSAHRIEGAFAAIFRQVAMNRFEDAVHTARRGSGELSSADFAATWMSTQQAMFGDSLTLREAYGNWWSYVPHFLMAPGYVYAYAFGHLLAFALYRQYQERGEEFVPDLLGMLAAGGSVAPNELVARAGVDLTDPGFWDAGLDVLEADVADAERLAADVT